MLSKSKAIDFIPLIISFIIFLSIIAFSVPTDIQLHSEFLSRFVTNDQFPIPPLYYLFIYIVSGLSSEANRLNIAAIVVLTVAVQLKYVMSVRLSRTISGVKPDVLFLKFAVIFVMFTAAVFYNPLAKSMYIGRISPNVWHNSTTIAVMPVALLTFIKSLEFLSDPRPRLSSVTSLIFLGLINALIKPSFLFCLIPALVIMPFLQYGLKSHAVKVGLLLSIIFTAFIVIEYYVIYQLGVFNLIYNNDNGGIAIDPLAFWSIYSSNIFLDAVFSLIFPIVYITLFARDVREHRSIQFSLCLFFISLFIGVVFAETGQRLPHGNFFWQVVISYYILFVVLMAHSLNRISVLGWSHPKIVVLACSFLLHLLSGVLYLFKLFYTSSYW